MKNIELNEIQSEILKAIEMLSEKEIFSESIIIKKIRQNTKFEGKNKAILRLKDIEKVLSWLEEKSVYYSVHLNSANDILLRKDTEKRFLEKDALLRREKSEKKATFLVGEDLKYTARGRGRVKKEKRTERTKMNIYDNFEEN